jgi:hypothetical protein
MTAAEVTCLKEIRARLDGAATGLSQVIVGQIEQPDGALDAILGLIEKARLELKALGQ